MSATEYRKLIVIVWLVVLASMAAIWGPEAWRGASLPPPQRLPQIET